MSWASKLAVAGAVGWFVACSAYGMRADLPFTRFAAEAMAHPHHAWRCDRCGGLDTLPKVTRHTW